MDRLLLEYHIKKNGKTIEELCSEVGISRTAYYRKTHGISEFTRREIQLIIECLKLESPMDIFFTDKVS